MIVWKVTHSKTNVVRTTVKDAALKEAPFGLSVATVGTALDVVDVEGFSVDELEIDGAVFVVVAAPVMLGGVVIGPVVCARVVGARVVAPGTPVR